MNIHNALSKAAEIAGSQKNLAVLIGVKHQTLWAWLARGNIPAERCPDIERATQGAVTCEELRPDLAEQWAYLRGTEKKEAA